MILQALYQYYQQMRAAGSKIAPPGMEWKAIPFIINISPEGNFLHLEDTRSKETKNGAEYLVPRFQARSGSKSYETAQMLWDHMGYVLGIAKDSSTNQEGEESVEEKQNLAFVAKVKDLRERFPNNRLIAAVASFYDRAQHKPIIQDEELISLLRSKVGANISFRVPDLESTIVAAHRDLELYMMELTASSDPETGSGGCAVCLVTGQHAPIVRLHPKIKLAGAQATASLINFQKNCGFDSYGKEQGLNAPVSTLAAEGIATAVNSLLSKDAETNYRIGDTTFVFWSSATDAELLSCYRTATFSGLQTLSEEEEEQPIAEITPSKNKRKSAKKTTTVDPTTNSYQVLETLQAACGTRGGRIRSGEDRFYILGLSPNAARISIKLWAEGTIAEIVGNTLRHQYDLNIISREGNLNEQTPPIRSIYAIVRTVSSSNKSDKWASNLIQSIVESIVTGTPYPHTLQQACLERIRHDQPISELRAAILKAYINRKHKQEVLSMALDDKQTNMAYLAGRLFALLENIQRCALGSGVNRTIRDSFYSSASTTPGAVFGRLINLAQAHLSKLRRDKPGLAINREKQLDNIYELLPGETPKFPPHFSLDEQSIFAVGYYHQRVELWKKRATDGDTSEDNEQN